MDTRMIWMLAKLIEKYIMIHYVGDDKGCVDVFKIPYMKLIGIMRNIFVKVCVGIIKMYMKFLVKMLLCPCLKPPLKK